MSMCAACRSFDRAKHPDQAAHGLGLCEGFEGANPPKVAAFVPWNAPGCVLFGKAADIRARRDWAIAQQKREKANSA